LFPEVLLGNYMASQNFVKVVVEAAANNSTGLVPEVQLGNYMASQNYVKVVAEAAANNSTGLVPEVQLGNHMASHSYNKAIADAAAVVELAAISSNLHNISDPTDIHHASQFTLAHHQMPHASASTMLGRAARVRILEFFSSQDAFDSFLHSTAQRSNALIMRTNKAVYGKRVRKYLMQAALPSEAVVVSCHPKKNCSVGCDERFANGNNYVAEAPVHRRPSLRGSAASTGSGMASSEDAWGFCHSPPSTSQMVYTQAELEDDSVEWVMWACHEEYLTHRMCHPIDIVVVDPAALRSAIASAM